MRYCDIYELVALLVTTQQVFLLLADIDHIHTEDIPYSDAVALLTYL